MYVIIDECFGAYQIREFFEARGHIAEGVGSAFPRRTPDPSILAFADKHAAVVVTRDNDYKTLKARAAGEIEGFRRAHRIVFVSCDGPKAMRRLEALIEDIEREYRYHCERGMRMTMWITGGNFRVER